jgi:hypothetical protein
VRRCAGLVLVVLATIFSGYAPSVAATKPRVAKVVVLTDAQVQSALLTLKDVPAGWSAVPIPPSVTAPSANTGLCNGPDEPALAANQDLAGSGHALLVKGKLDNVADAAVLLLAGPAVAESVYSFPSTKDAAGYFAAAKESKRTAASTTRWTSPDQKRLRSRLSQSRRSVTTRWATG